MLDVLAAISVIWFLAHLSPGPDFLVTVRVAMTQSRMAAFRTVLGISVGTVAWCVAGFFGIHVLFASTPWLYLALKYAGGGYLAYLGIRMVIAGLRPPPPEAAAPPMSAASAFRLGLLTNLANPKAALFTASVFAATLPPDPPASLGVAAAVLMTAISLIFYGFLALVLTTPRASSAYARAQRWIDLVAGAAFVFFAVDFIRNG